MESPEILKQSALMLFREPLLFAPKIVSTLISSLLIIGLLSGREILLEMNLLTLLILLISAPIFITIIGVLASITVAGMVKYHGEKNSLRKSLSDIKNRMNQAFKTAAFFLLVGTLLGIIFLIGYSIYLYSGNLTILLLSGVVVAAVTLGISYIAYFLPATLLEFSSLRKSFQDSYKTSNENSKLVTLLILLSIFLLGLSFQSSGRIEKFGYLGFILGRLTSSVVNTYVFVVSPNLYYSASESTD